MKLNSALWQKEDYWAIWIGGFLLLSGLILFWLNTRASLDREHQKLEMIMANELKNAPFKTIAWHEAAQQQENLKAADSPLGKALKKLTGKPQTWKCNPLRSFGQSELQAQQIRSQWQSELELISQQEALAYANAAQAVDQARALNFEDQNINQKAQQQIDQWLKTRDALEKIEQKHQAKAYLVFPALLFVFLIFAVLFGVSSQVRGLSFLSFLKGFAFVFVIGVIAYVLASNQTMKNIGFGYAAWAILLGLTISNTVGTPGFVKPSLQTELYIKTGLVLLGAEILLGKIMAIGLPGIFVAWVVTPVVLVTTYWFGQKILKISSKTLNMTISADMSVCGVSAAVATAAACNAKKEELTLAIGMSMLFTSVMMILLPVLINWIGMPEVLGGAWIGGTIDATGAVVAAGAFLGDNALSVAATIKMIQNVLIGIIAFFVAVYFATKVEKQGQVKVGPSEIWKRFPKFILGFMGASLLFTLIYAGLGPNLGYSIIEEGVIAGFSKNLRGWLFCLAFVSIGLATNFRELKSSFKGGKPLILYLSGQTLNLLLTLLMAYIMFYLVFPQITESLGS